MGDGTGVPGDEKEGGLACSPPSQTGCVRDHIDGIWSSNFLKRLSANLPVLYLTFTLTSRGVWGPGLGQATFLLGYPQHYFSI